MQTDTNPDEKQAIHALKQGDITGLNFLVQTYQVKAVHAALLIVNDLSTAEEIVQEAFLHAYRKIHQFDDERPFGPWFLRSVIHAAFKTAQRQERLQPLEDEHNETAEWLIDPARSPQEMAENAETRAAIWDALQQLTPDQRKALVLRYFLDENESEMVRTLGRPRSTVKWWLHAGRKRLRRLLRAQAPEEIEDWEDDHECQ